LDSYYIDAATASNNGSIESSSAAGDPTLKMTTDAPYSGANGIAMSDRGAGVDSWDMGLGRPLRRQRTVDYYGDSGASGGESVQDAADGSACNANNKRPRRSELSSATGVNADRSGLSAQSSVEDGFTNDLAGMFNRSCFNILFVLCFFLLL
jgi:hypothetical protein